MSLDGATIAVLIPAYNEEAQIGGVLSSLPAFVDHVVVVDDGSTDQTSEVVESIAHTDPRVRLFRLPKNRGCGGAIAVAYDWARDAGVDVAVSIDGDGQMDPADMERLVRPILDGRADFTKGNRLTQPADLKEIPRLRLFGNVVLSVLTKIASGYWTIADSQTGYTAMGRHALENVDWDKLYARYGRPNDLLVRANVARCRAADVPVRAVYGVGEKSSMKVLKVTFAIAWMLFRRFWWRLWTRHVLLEFHPMVFLYALGAFGAVVSTALSVHVARVFALTGLFPRLASVALVVFAVTTLNALFLAFWMDLLANQHLSLPLEIDRRRRSRASPPPDGPVAVRSGDRSGNRSGDRSG